ncbi:titin homolog isoform X2 [Schistocerca gregaria]|uniref:titin homolog isoform X2 n=1 Tax=Schistocerca gregaria TaxID=7010 RepID=UPI00211E2FD0|nr:titin homolog isoform X2 [Schistocerca gregaria]
MATRRCRIKAVANVSVSRGRCGEKPRENEKTDEKTSSKSSATPDYHEVSPRETILPESASEFTVVGKLHNDSSLNETLENAPVCHLVQNPENVSESTCLEGSGSSCSSPMDAPNVVSSKLIQQGYVDSVQTGNCDGKEVSLCNRPDERITDSAGEHSFKTEDISDSVRPGDSCVTGAQKIDITEKKIPSAPLRLSRKRMKPTVSLSVVNRKPKENSTLEITDQCSSLKETLENTSVGHLDQNSRNFNELTHLEANSSDRSTHEDTLSIVDCHLAQHTGYADVQHSDNSDSNDVSFCNRTDEKIAASTDEHSFKIEESINSVGSGESGAKSVHETDTMEVKTSTAPTRLSRKRMKPTVSLSLLSKKAKEDPTVENSPVCNIVENAAHVSETTCWEASGGGTNPVDAQSVVDCHLTQHTGYADIQQSDNCASEDVSLCKRTEEGGTAPTNEHNLRTQESIDCARVGDSCASAQKIDVTETKISSAPLRLPRKRVKPTVSLSSVNKKAKDNPLIENASVHHFVENLANVSEQTCSEANSGGFSTPLDAQSVVDCHLTQHQSVNSANKDASLCERTDEDVTTSADEHHLKTQKSIDCEGLRDSSAASAQEIDVKESKVSSAPVRLQRKRMKPTVSLSLVNRKAKEDSILEITQQCDPVSVTLENTSVGHLVQNSASVSEATYLEANGSDRSTPEGMPSIVDCHLAQHPGYADAQHSDNCDSNDVSLCNRTDEKITASTDKHSFKSEESTNSVRSGESCATSVHKADTLEVQKSSALTRLPRKRMKPVVSLSLVNKKVKENHTAEVIQHCSASKADDHSTAQAPKKLQTFVTSSNLHQDVEAGGSGRTIPAVGCETGSSSVSHEVNRKISPEFLSQASVCNTERKNKVAPDVVSVDTPVGEQRTSAVVNTSTYESPPVSDSASAEKDKGTSSSVKCSVSQSGKDCSQLNSFRSRFIRPKPLLESAARRNRTGSIGSASESDSEKKSLSSATTVSPPWKPRIKTSRTKLTHVQSRKNDKLANASGVSTDESEDEHSSISRAATISPPKKIARLDSGSDTSHSEFSQEVSEESSSPIKKPYAKAERVTKRKEYLRRIIEIKKEISHKVSDGKVNRSRLTMFDLIYYNPVTNPMKSVQEPDVRNPGPAPTNATENENRLAEESVDEPEALEDEEQSSTVPVPQVKVGPNGEIILDEQSLVIETTDAKKNWNDLQNSEVIMDYGTGTTTFNAYSKKRKSKTKDWNREETLRFYRALHTVGTDFLVMQSLFPKFTRKDLKDRYKKEEKINRELVEKALRNPLTFDLTELQKEFEVERLEEEQHKKAEKPKRKGSARRSCSLFAVLDSTDRGEVRSEGKNLVKRKIKEKPVKRKSDKPKDSEETHHKKKRKADTKKAAPEYTLESDVNNSKRRTDDKGTTSECKPDSGDSNPVNGHVDSESNVPEATCLMNRVKPTRSGRIPRPRIFEDFMTEDMEEMYEETEITEICDRTEITEICDRTEITEICDRTEITEIYDRVTVEDICDSEPVGDDNPNDHEELVESENAMVNEDSVASYESENEQNFVIAEDGLTVEQNQVNLGSVYSNVKPGTLIVLATESPDNPGHQIYRVFMVSNNSQTMPVSVPNNQASPADTTNSIETGTSTHSVVPERSTNDCNSLQVNAESNS